MKKILLSGLIAGAVLLLVSVAGLYVLLWQMPDMAMEYFGPAFISQVQRNILYYVHPFVIGISLSWLWDRLQNTLKGPALAKIMKFSVFYMTIATLPFMILIYSAINVSVPIILTWLVFGFIEAAVAATIFTRQHRL